MKKIIFLLIIGLSFTQFRTNTVTTGAIGSYKNEPRNERSWLTIEPEIGYFIANNISIDFITKLEWDTDGKETETDQNIGAVITYYSFNRIYSGIGFLKNDDFDSADFRIHLGLLEQVSNNIYFDFRLYLKTEGGSGFDGFSEELYEYGFDIGIKGFFSI